MLFYIKTFNDSSTSATSTAAQNFSLVKLFAPVITASASNTTTTTASTLEIAGPPTGSSVTVTNGYSLNVMMGIF